MIVAWATRQGLLAPPAIAAVDTTGLEARHANVHYRYAYTRAYRTAYTTLHRGVGPVAAHARATCPQLTLVVHTRSHLIAGALPVWGPAPDAPTFAPVLRQVATLIDFRAAVADAGFDAEAAHRLYREALGMEATAIALNRRRARHRWPPAPYRRAMRRAFPRALYGERQQVGSMISRIKRRLGAALTAERPTQPVRSVGDGR